MLPAVFGSICAKIVILAVLVGAQEYGTNPRTSISDPSSSRVHDPARRPVPAAVQRPITRTRRPNKLSAVNASSIRTSGA